MNKDKIEKYFHLSGLIFLILLVITSCGLYRNSVDEQLADGKVKTTTMPVQNINIEKKNLKIELTQVSLLKSKARRWYNINNEDKIRNDEIDFQGYEFVISVCLLNKSKSENDVQAVIEDIFFYDDNNCDLEIDTKSTVYNINIIDDNMFELIAECYIPVEKYDINAISKIDIMLCLTNNSELYMLSIDL